MSDDNVIELPANGDALTKAPKKRVIGRPIQKGQVLNPHGRPKGSRNKVVENCIVEMNELFREGGKEMLRGIMMNEPGTFLKAIIQLAPKQNEVGEPGAFDDMSDEDLHKFIAESVRTLKQAGVSIK